MLDLKCLRSISERDIDLLLVEELASSDAFCNWFVQRLGGSPLFMAIEGLWHSVCDPALGETDVLFKYRGQDNRTTAILIEDKISAPPQPEQAERYRKRGERGREAGDWDEFYTCLIAPQLYLDAACEAGLYDATLAYEGLAEYFRVHAESDRRFAHKHRVVIDAIEQNRRGYCLQVDDNLTQFVAAYAHLCRTNFPQLQMEPVRDRGPESTWVRFDSHVIPPGADLRHQLRAGWVKLFFRQQTDGIDAIQSRYGAALPAGFQISPAGKSVVIGARVPVMDARATPLFEGHAENAKVALDCVTQLLAFLSRVR